MQPVISAGKQITVVKFWKTYNCGQLNGPKMLESQARIGFSFVPDWLKKNLLFRIG